MAHYSHHWLSLVIFLSHKLNSFCLLKTFIIISLIYGDFVQLKRSPNIVVANKNSTTKMSLYGTSHVADDSNIVVAINDINGHFFNSHQILFDTLQPRLHDLLSLSMENCTEITNCDSKTCDTNSTTLATKNSSCSTTSTQKTQPATVRVNSDKMMANTTSKMSLTNVSTTSTVSSEVKSSTVSFTSLSSSPTSLLLRQQRLLSRPKRYLSFPEGSSFSVAVCFTVGIIGNPRYNYMSFGLNWGVAYDLPNTTWILNHLHGFAKRPIPVAVWHRRSRRSLYKEIENVVDNMGYNGRDCILRALCESRQYFQGTKMSMIGEMMRVLFSLPKQRIFSRELTESADIVLYDQAYRKARSISDCSVEYDCSFSLLELAFGKYSTPPDGYYTKH